MTAFDPDAFMQQTMDQPLETERTLIKPGEYQGSIDDFTKDAFETFSFTYKKGPRAGEEGEMTKFSIPIVLNDDTLRAEMGTDKVVAYFDCTLDFDENGQLQWGKNRNIDLGKIRAAVNQNAPNQPWTVGNLRGAGPLMVKVEHQEGKRKDGSPWKIAKVVRVAPIR